MHDPDRPDLLIVEDNPQILRSLLMFMAPLRLDIASASDGDEGMRRIEQVKSLGGLVTDVRMPGSVDGMVLSAAARRRFPSMPVLLMTGFAPPDDLARALGPGCRLLHKPFRPRELLREVMDMLAIGESRPAA